MKKKHLNLDSWYLSRFEQGTSQAQDSLPHSYV